MTEPVAPPAPATVPPFPALGSADFNQEAYDNGAAMPGVMENIAQQAQASYTNALAAKEKAEAAGVSAGTATTQADLAMGYRNTASSAAGTATAAAGTATTKRDEAVAAAGVATTKRDEATSAASTAVTARDESVAARDQAQVFATQQLKASSASNLVPGAGDKSFAVEASRSFVAGMYLVATSTGAPANKMSGYVTSYNSATGALLIGVDAFSGTAARSDWVIGVAAPVASGSGGLTRQLVTANTACLAGVEYIVGAPGVILTFPAVWAVDDRIAITEAIGGGAQYTVQWGTTPLRGRVLGTQVITAAYASTGALRYENITQGLC